MTIASIELPDLLRIIRTSVEQMAAKHKDDQLEKSVIYICGSLLMTIILNLIAEIDPLPKEEDPCVTPQQRSES